LEQTSELAVHLALDATTEQTLNPDSDLAIFPGRKPLHIYLPFPARVRGRDLKGRTFEEHTFVESLSATHLCLQLVRRVKLADRLRVVISFSLHDETETSEVPPPHPRVALQARVRRAEGLASGRWLIEMELGKYRFLYEHGTMSKK